jgi:hypothetical protein
LLVRVASAKSSVWSACAMAPFLPSATRPRSLGRWS